MYAIAKIAGKQYRLEPDLKLKVPRLAVQEGATYEIGEILLASDDEGLKVGQPLVDGIKVTARVVEHGRFPKIVVFRKKRRKGFRVTRGHRQDYTLLHIEEIQGLKGKPKKAVEKKKTAEKSKPEAKQKATPKPKPAAKKKAAVKTKKAAKIKAKSKPAEKSKKSAAAKKASKTEKSKGE